jgi:ABC-type sugar transport system substrate-binding protein
MSERTPTVGWVGGLSRLGGHLEEAAAQAGFKLQFHDGNVAGNRSKALREIVRRSQALVIAVGLISHQGALTAREEAKQAGIPVVFVKKASQLQVSEALSSLRQQIESRGLPTLPWGF